MLQDAVRAGRGGQRGNQAEHQAALTGQGRGETRDPSPAQGTAGLGELFAWDKSPHRETCYVSEQNTSAFSLASEA